MEPIGQVVNSLLTKVMTTSQSSITCSICDKEIPAIEVDVLGNKRWVQPVCECEKEAKLAQVKEYESYQREKYVRELFSISNVGDKFLNADFDNFIQREGTTNAYKIAKHYANNFDEFGKESVMFWGEPGNGKTHLAAAIHNQLRKQGKVVVFMSMPDLLKKIKSTFNKNDTASESEILKALNMCDLLIIDDLGAEKTSEWVEETIFTIIDSRYRCEKPILATSNLEPKHLPSKIGKRSYDRLIELSQPIENKATSYRKQIAAQRRSKFDEILKNS